MSAPSIGVGFQAPRNIVTPPTAWSVSSSALVTTNTAYASRASKADLVYAVGDATPQPQTNLAAGRVMINPPPGLLLLLQPYGQGADNETGDMRIWAWNEILNPFGAADAKRKQWHAHLLAEVRFTLSADVGLALGILDENIRYADTIAATTDRTLVPSFPIADPAAADDSSVFMGIDTAGAPVIELELRRETIATGVGCLWRCI